jgi:TrmH family RNA methyltransferase
MITKKELQYYSSLLNKKYRKKENKFLVDGKNIVLEGLKSNYRCEIIFLTAEFFEMEKEIVSSIQNSKQKFEILKRKEFLKIADTETPQGIAAVFYKQNRNAKELNSINDDLIVMLDNISEPGNLGTIIRNCDWFGIRNLFLSDNSTDFTNSKVIRASMGSLFHVTLWENFSYSKLKEFKENEYEILCADIQGTDVFSYTNEKKKILILSNEAHGPSPEIESISDKKITIPKIGKAESLNVASASAVLLAILTK